MGRDLVIVRAPITIDPSPYAPPYAKDAVNLAAYPLGTGANIAAAITAFDGERGTIFLAGDYAVSSTITVPANVDVVGLSRGARLVSTVTGGPTLHLLGTHTGTAQPNTLSVTTSNKQLAPTLANFQIQGNATTVASTCGGILIESVMAPTVRDVWVRECSYGIKVATRARNVLIAGCHLYNNYGKGIHVEDANVHQMQVTDCHVMYNVGGVYVTGGETYNFVCNDNVIEYYDGSFGSKLASGFQHGIYIASDTALILHIVGNNIETSQNTESRNVYLLGTNVLGNEYVGQATITGNTVSLGNVGIRLENVTDVALAGNALLNGTGANIASVQVIDSQNVVIGAQAHSANSRYHETSGSAGGILVDNSRIVNISGVTVARPLDLPAAAIQVTDSDLVSVDACMVIDPHKVGILLDGTTKNSRVTNCTVLDTRGTKKMTRPIQETGTADSNVIAGNRVNDGVTGGIAVVGASTINSGNHSLEYAA